jgi:hypothetical protein
MRPHEGFYTSGAEEGGWPIRPLKTLIAQLVASLTIRQLHGVRRTDQMEKRHRSDAAV